MSVTSPRFSLYKRRDTQTFSIGYYVNGKRRWKSTGSTTKPEALRALTQFRELLAERGHHVSLVQFTADFLAFAQANYSPKTFVIYRAALGRLALVAGNISLKEVTAEHFDRYKAKRLKDKTKAKHPKEISPVSVNVELRMLKAAFNTARRWKLLDVDIFDGVRLAEVLERAPLFLTPQDFERLIACIREGWFRELVTFAVLTGMRRGELLNLRWCDVDLSRKLVQIQSSATFRTKQGRRRTIPLSETAMYLLNARHGKSTSEYVFTLNDKQINAGWVTHRFKKYIRRAGLNDRLKFHSLRHTFATWLVQRGSTLFEVQKLLGHSSSAVTEMYSHLQPEQMHSTVNRIDLNLN